MVGYFIYISVCTGDGCWLALLIESFYIVDVFPEFMGSITAGGGATHPKDGCPCGNITDDQFDLGLMVSQVGKRNDITDPLSESQLCETGKNKEKRNSLHDGCL